MKGITKTSTVIFGLAVVASLAACVPDPYSQRNGSSTNTQYVNYAPTPPPEPMLENVPPAPGPTVYWQPGHWGWTGTQWSWLGGHYEQRPYQAAAWEPGHWQQGSNGYFWVDGRWR
jgi:hypothetical protein